MVSGKKVAVAFFGVVGVTTLVLVSLGLEKQGRTSEAFLTQMAEAPRCAIFNAPVDGVRRQGLLALVELHPEWGIDAEAIRATPGAVDNAGVGELPPREDGGRRGWVELAWASPGAADDAPLAGARVFCEGEVAFRAVPVLIPRGEDRLRSQGSVLLPPQRGKFPAEARPLPAVDGSGAAVAGLSLRQRCAPAEGGEACLIDAYNPAMAEGFVALGVVRREGATQRVVDRVVVDDGGATVEGQVQVAGGAALVCRCGPLAPEPLAPPTEIPCQAADGVSPGCEGFMVPAP